MRLFSFFSRVSRETVREPSVDVRIEEVQEVTVIDDVPAGSSVTRNSIGLLLLVAWHRIGYWLLWLLFFLLPFYVLPLTSFPVHYNKQFLAIALLLGAFMCWLVLVLRDGVIRFPRGILNTAVGVLVIAGVLTTWASISPLTSIRGVSAEAFSLLNILLYGLAFFLTQIFVATHEDLKRIIWAVVASAGIAGAVVMLQLFDVFLLPWEIARSRSFTPVGSPEKFAAYLAPAFVMVVGLAGRFADTTLKKIILGVSGILVFASLYFINFFAAWIGMLIGALLITAYLFFAQNVRRANLPLLIVAISAVIIFVSWPQPQSPPNQPPALPLYGQREVARDLRPAFTPTLNVMRGALSGMRILAGTGPATFGYDYSLYRPEELNRSSLWGIRFLEGYSSILTAITEMGLIGLLAVTLLAVAILSITWSAISRSSADEELSFPAMAFAAAAVAGMVLWLLHPVSFTAALTLFFFLGILQSVHVLAGESTDYEFVMFASPAKALGISLASILLLIATAAALFYSVQSYRAAIAFAEVIEEFRQSSNTAQVGEGMDRVKELDSRETRYLRVHAQAYLQQARDVLSKRDIPAENRARQAGNLITQALASSDRAVALDPADSLNHVMRARIYQFAMLLTGAQGADRALRDFTEARSRDPKSPELPLNAAQVYVDRSDILALEIRNLEAQRGATPAQIEAQQDERKRLLADSVRELDTAIALKSDYAPALLLRAQVFDRLGRVKEAQAELAKLRRERPGDVGLAFQLGFLYYKDQKFAEAKAQFQSAVDQSANYSNARYFLGLLFDREGEREEALKQFEHIAGLNPDNQEVRRIVENLRQGRPALEQIVPPAPAPETRSTPPVEDTGGKEEALPPRR